MVGKARQSNQS